MKKYFIIIFILLCSFSFSFSEEPPEWYADRCFCFPESEYISSVGSGFTKIAAEEDALSKLALFFETNISVNKSSGLYVVDKMNELKEKTRTVSSDIHVGSEVSLPCVQFTSCFYDKAADEYYVCAYIKKREAVKDFESKLKISFTKADDFYSHALSAGDDFYSCRMAKCAEKIIQESFLNIERLILLDIKKGEYFINLADDLNSKCTKILNQKKKNLIFSINIDGDKNKSISTVIKNLFEKQNFVCSAKNPIYKINGEIHFVESEVTGIGVFVRPSISINVESKITGQTLSSYSRQLPKYGHKNIDGAYSKALTEIELDLKANLMDSLFNE